MMFIFIYVNLPAVEAVTFFYSILMFNFRFIMELSQGKLISSSHSPNIRSRSGSNGTVTTSH